METRVAVIGIIVENEDSIGKLNELLHEYGWIINYKSIITYRIILHRIKPLLR